MQDKEGLALKQAFEPDNAMGLYHITRNNRDKLKACRFDRVEYNKQFNATVFIFNDPYRKLNIDLLFTGYGNF